MNHHGFTPSRRRLATVAGSAITMAAVLGVAGCAGDTPVQRARAVSTAPSAADSGSDVPDPVTPQPSAPGAAPQKPGDLDSGDPDLLPDDPPADGTDVGYVSGYFPKGGTIYLAFDRVAVLAGDAAREAREAAGLPYEEGVDGLSTYIENSNPALREVPVDDFATVIGSQQLLGDASEGPAELELADLMLHLDQTERPLLVEVTYDGVRVGTVTEFYLP